MSDSNQNATEEDRLRQMSDALRRFVEAMKGARPSLRQVGDCLDRLSLSFHKPVDVGEGGQMHLVCPRCKVDFPCQEFVKIGERIAPEQITRPSEEVHS